MMTFYRGKARSACAEVPVVNVISGLGVIDITLGRRIGVYIWYDTTTDPADRHRADTGLSIIIVRRYHQKGIPLLLSGSFRSDLQLRFRLDRCFQFDLQLRLRLDCCFIFLLEADADILATLVVAICYSGRADLLLGEETDVAARTDRQTDDLSESDQHVVDGLE
jgi:hypothetical protein